MERRTDKRSPLSAIDGILAVIYWDTGEASDNKFRARIELKHRWDMVTHTTCSAHGSQGQQQAQSCILEIEEE